MNIVHFRLINMREQFLTDIFTFFFRTLNLLQHMINILINPAHFPFPDVSKISLCTGSILPTSSPISFFPLQASDNTSFSHVLFLANRKKSNPSFPFVSELDTEFLLPCCTIDYSGLLIL